MVGGPRDQRGTTRRSTDGSQAARDVEDAELQLRNAGVILARLETASTAPGTMTSAADRGGRGEVTGRGKRNKPQGRGRGARAASAGRATGRGGEHSARGEGSAPSPTTGNRARRGEHAEGEL